MGNCCDNNLNKIFCNAYNKYYNTLYTNGEISKKETENLLVISYIRKLFLNPLFAQYRNIFLKALRCIANNSCLLDSTWLYNRGPIPTIKNLYVIVTKMNTFVEKDPIFMASPAATITTEEINNWNNIDSGVFIVPVRIDSGIKTDITFTQIHNAWESGKNIIVNLEDGLGVYQLSYIDEGGAWFFRIDYDSTSPYIEYISVSVTGNNDTWTKNIIRLATP